ncbi:MAG: hypothetical protein IPF92_19185 [Myxococcales bacterium]|nr:hypothetical protein [Myxococcales bacterium]HQY62764.1 hypothetical protein [Polyangiaceae bacterium]
MGVRGLALAGVVSCGALACVHIPDSLRADFREVGPGERSNFRAGAHGTAKGRDLVGPMPSLTRDAGEGSPDSAAPEASAPPAASVAPVGSVAAPVSQPADGGGR